MEFQLSYFKSWKMMLWKCCTQYASKFGKPSSGHRTGKGQFSSQSQRKAMPKNVQTTAQLHSSHTLARNAQNSPSQASTVCELWNSRCSSNIYKRQRNQRSNCQHPLDHWKSKRVPENHLLLLYWLHQNLDCVDHSKLCKLLKEMGIPDDLTRLLRNLYASQEATVRTGHGTTDWFQIGKVVHHGFILSPAYLTFMQSTSCKMPAGWSTSWNQDCWNKYQ